MILTAIHIANFRSVVDVRLLLTERTVGLLGLNESGKSNILNALGALGTYEFTARDKSKISNQLPCITYVFNLDNADRERIVDELLSKTLISTYVQGLITSAVMQLAEVKYLVYADESNSGVESSVYWEDTLSYEFLKDNPLCRRKKDQQVDESVLVEIESKKHKLTDYVVVEKSLIPEVESSKFNVITIQVELNEIIETYLDTLIPKVVYWEYSDKFLLPSEIGLDDFIKDDKPQDNCAPLFNIIKLCEEINVSTGDDLKLKTAIWKSDPSQRRKDSSIITASINDYVKKIWGDYDQMLNIDIEESKITIHITDPNSPNRNYYDMVSRSQGCKTFLSFILTIAAEAKHGQISNCILLLDEPETHLHPSGVRHMKHELLELGRNGNYVVFATHSVFMIDRQNLRRHFIVSKDKEVTTITRVERNNFIQETVLYQALGTSVDEFSIGPKNIVFEGELDLKLFSFFLDVSFAGEQGMSKDYRFWDGGGVKRMEQFFNQKMLPPESRWIVVLDNDQPGQKFKKAIDENYSKGTATVVAVMYSAIPNEELEDLLPIEMVEAATKAGLLAAGLEFPATLLSAASGPWLPIIDGHLAKNQVSKDKKSSYDETFKQHITHSVSTKLDDISKMTRNEQMAAFEKFFPKYLPFAQSLQAQLT